MLKLQVLHTYKCVIMYGIFLCGLAGCQARAEISQESLLPAQNGPRVDRLIENYKQIRKVENNVRWPEVSLTLQQFQSEQNQVKSPFNLQAALDYCSAYSALYSKQATKILKVSNLQSYFLSACSNVSRSALLKYLIQPGFEPVFQFYVQGVHDEYLLSALQSPFLEKMRELDELKQAYNQTFWARLGMSFGLALSFIEWSLMLLFAYNLFTAFQFLVKNEGRS